MIAKLLLISFIMGIILMIVLNLLDISINMKDAPICAIASMPPYGYITLTEDRQDNVVIVKTKLKGLPAGSKLGCHIHQYGDIRDCQTTGPHYNPHNKHHGGPHDINRHIGDLGNLRVKANGQCNQTILMQGLKLSGKYSVIGRALVIHAGEDDLGKGGTEMSMTTGNSGKRMACGVIGLMSAC